MGNWTKPVYEYGASTTLDGLLGEFLRANNDDVKGLVAELGCNEDQVIRWMANEITVGLACRYKVRFEQITGIELERLYVIEAKKSLLAKLANVKSLDRVFASDPSMWRLLTRVADLKDRICFDTLTTRNEIIRHLRVSADRCGRPLIGLQIGVNGDQIDKWREDGERRPSGDNLERALAGLYSGLIQDPNVDNTRFLVTAEAIFGCAPTLVIGVDSLSAAINKLFGSRDDPLSVLSNRTGIGTTVVKNLLHYKPNGNIPFATMVAILRALIKQSKKEELERFDAAAEKFLADVAGGKIELEPMFCIEGLSKSNQTNTKVNVEVPTPELKPAEQRVNKSSHIIGHAVAKPSGPADILDLQAKSLALALVSQIEGARSQLILLKTVFPNVVEEYPAIDSLVGKPLESKPKAIEVNSLKATRVHLETDEVDRLLRFFETMADMCEMVCGLDAEQREEILGLVDPLLVRIKITLDAAGVTEPKAYLRLMRESGAKEILGR